MYGTIQDESKPLKDAAARHGSRVGFPTFWRGKWAVLTAAALVVLGLSQTSTSAPLASTRFCDSTAQSSGYIKLPNKQDGHYFYWFFESRSNPDTDPLVLWLTGGPGGSSLLALLTENGPCTIADDDITTIGNPYSWTTRANVIWVDQPIGTGFSYGTADDADHNSTQVGENMYFFLQRWLKQHPKFANHRFFLTGESYAGHYVPAVATALLKTAPSPGDVHIQLEGVAIGNGLTSPLIQMQHQIDMIRDNSYGKVLLNGSDYTTYQNSVSTIVHLIEECYAHNDTACTDATVLWLPTIVQPLLTISKVNQYDLRESLGDGHENPAAAKQPTGGLLSKESLKTIGNPHAHAFLNNPVVQAYLNIPHYMPWTEISQDVFGRFSVDFFQNRDGDVAYLLEHKIRVLIYAGDADLVCNWKGNLAWTTALSWSGAKAFNAAKEEPFVVRGVAKGTLQAAGNFAFLRVFDAGHMVPENQPEASLAMLNRFLANAPLHRD
ncbi:hypothetical protein H310_06273 [Aphanomyces invadans]|uniref:Carboxypeptidase n=1 Tax=Aphanomyces invadans TaxID=157072 RepID=A0A024U5U6_9STRA|nr:hypothetical protein H310_06273 [Aphanomyces invadans]ETW01644.1 hypothetical protein H310_06273 [Aphanomyces invadans]|eukprot:XP_008869492.1 hypothetical protein H310_06273 [Aphanomyces invadans]